MIKASAARSASIPFGGAMRAADRPRVQGDRPSAPSRSGGRRTPDKTRFPLRACHPRLPRRANFELELSERRIAADLAASFTLQASGTRPCPGQEVAVDLRLLAGL